VEASVNSVYSKVQVFAAAVMAIENRRRSLISRKHVRAGRRNELHALVNWRKFEGSFYNWLVNCPGYVSCVSRSKYKMLTQNIL
jgi:hypothetical protein